MITLEWHFFLVIQSVGSLSLSLHRHQLTILLDFARLLMGVLESCVHLLLVSSFLSHPCLQ